MMPLTCVLDPSAEHTPPAFLAELPPASEQIGDGARDDLACLITAAEACSDCYSGLLDTLAAQHSIALSNAPQPAAAAAPSHAESVLADAIWSSAVIIDWAARANGLDPGTAAAAFSAQTQCPHLLVSAMVEVIDSGLAPGLALAFAEQARGMGPMFGTDPATLLMYVLKMSVAAASGAAYGKHQVLPQ